MSVRYYERMDKESVLKKCQSEYERYGQLLEYYEMFKETLKEFDGKVYNKRFRDALSKKIDNKRVVVSEVYQLVYYNTGSYIDIIIKVYPSDCHEDEVSMVVRIYCNMDKRINAKASLANRSEKNCVDNMKEIMNYRKDTIENYDTYREQAEQLRDAIDEFNNNVPYPFRRNIIGSYFSVYCG